MKRILSTALAALLVSCNLTESVKSTKATGPKLAPRLETANGATLPVTDSVHVKVWSTAPATVWYEKTLGWSAKFVVISGVPAGTSFLLSMEGRAKQLDGTQAVWWTGTQTGTASEPQTVDAQVLTVPVTVRDIKAPTISSLPKDTILDSAVAGVRLRWNVADDSLATVTLNGKGLTPASNIVTDSVTVSVGGSVKAILKATDKVGNVSLDTVLVSRKAAGNAVVVSNGIPWNESIAYDTLTDSRDGKTYRTVLIGSQTWMAENLNYAGKNNDTGVCYNNKADSCAKYGRLYTWNEAMAGAASSSAVPSGVQGVCPTGWHVPSDGEWDTLVKAVGNNLTGKQLKSIRWDGTDAYGFRAIYSGNLQNGTFMHGDSSAAFWSTLQGSGTFAWERDLFSGITTLNRNNYPKDYSFSLRCIQNSGISLATAYGQRQLPAGTFQMGSASGLTDENPVHSVTLRSFWMDTTEVTQSEFTTLMKRNHSYFTGNLKNPVERVTWYDALLFCNARSKRDKFDSVYSYTGSTVDANGSVTNLTGLVIDLTKSGYHLPTEAQWEYAARAGSKTKFHWGDDASVAGEYAWYTQNSSSTTHPVAGKKPNAWGLYDISGNVWEWTQDWYGAYTATAQIDPTGAASGTTKARRGGSWDAVADLQSNDGIVPIIPDIRTAYRYPDKNSDYPGNNQMNNFGFRCARGGGGSVISAAVINPSVGTPSGNVGFSGIAQKNIGSTCEIWPANQAFTMEYWVRPERRTFLSDINTWQSVGENRALAARQIDTGDVRFRRTWAGGFWALHPDLNLLRVSDADTLPVGAWTHAAFVYTGSEGIIYINGVEKARIADSRSMLCGSSVILTINADGAVIDNIRVSNSIRYTTSFSPPASYEKDANAIFQWTFDGANANSLKDEIQGISLISDSKSPAQFVAK